MGSQSYGTTFEVVTASISYDCVFNILPIFKMKKFFGHFVGADSECYSYWETGFRTCKELLPDFDREGRIVIVDQDKSIASSGVQYRLY